MVIKALAISLNVEQLEYTVQALPCRMLFIKGVILVEDMSALKYVGGPRHGQTFSKPPATKSWPPKVVGCVSDIKPGDKMGLYRLRGATLEWFLLKPVQIKR